MHPPEGWLPSPGADGRLSCGQHTCFRPFGAGSHLVTACVSADTSASVRQTGHRVKQTVRIHTHDT
eukprot:scaffold26835_cov42-Prasinocladus_malaysianus.AAC.1